MYRYNIWIGIRSTLGSTTAMMCACRCHPRRRKGCCRHRYQRAARRGRIAAGSRARAAIDESTPGTGLPRRRPSPRWCEAAWTAHCDQMPPSNLLEASTQYACISLAREPIYLLRATAAMSATASRSSTLAATGAGASHWRPAARVSSE